MSENPKLTPRAKEQVLGCMVGGAVGDALGYAVEFASYDSIVKKYGEKGITRFKLDRHGVAEISDDTQMSLFTAAGILLGMPAWILGSWMCRSCIPVEHLVVLVWQYCTLLMREERPATTAAAAVV